RGRGRDEQDEDRQRTPRPEAAPSCGELSGRRKNQEVQDEATHDDRQREEPAPADDSRDQHLGERHVAHDAKPPSADAEGKVTFRPVTVPRDDAPEHAILPGWQWRQADLEEGLVAWIDVRVALVDTLTVGILDTNGAEDGLELSIEPDADGR